MYDILIQMAEKDFVKFPYLYKSIMSYLEGFDKIYCVTPVPVPFMQRIDGVLYYLDEDVIDFDFSKCKGITRDRAGWYKQQFIELFQMITKDEYFQVDSDVVFKKKISVIENGKPSFLFGKDQNHAPYYELTQTLFGYGREYPYSFINEMMYFKRSIIHHLISSTGLSKYGFFDLIIAELNRKNEVSGMSEYDLYGNYVAKHFKDTYNYKYLSAIRGSKKGLWTTKEIEAALDRHKNSVCDIITFHSYI